MKREYHPYGDFIPKHAKIMIVGSFPIGKFTDPGRKNEIKPHEFDFYFGGERNLLWKLMGDVYKRKFENRKEIVRFLNTEGIAIGDVIKSCCRVNRSASDSALVEIEWNTDLLENIKRHHIGVLYFTSKQVMLWFNRLFPNHGLKEILLLSPSSQSARSVARSPEYLKWKENNPDQKTYKFILNNYKNAFRIVKKIN